MRTRIALTVGAAVIVIGASGCSAESGSPGVQEDLAPIPARTVSSSEGFILQTGEGELLQNGIVVKASPATGTEGSILVEQTFPRGGSTILHIHEQGDELFYVVSGRGRARLGERTDEIGPGDVVFVPRSAVHRIENLDHDQPLRVVFFMDSPELVEQFRAIHERVASEPDRPLTPEELALIEEQIGGGRTVMGSQGH